MYQRSNRVVAARDAQQVAWGAPVSRDPDWQAAQGTGAQGLAQANRVNVLVRLGHSSMTRVEAPPPCVINLSVTEFQQSRVSPQELILVHLKQHLMDTRVRAGGDESLDLHAFARQVMFVSITIVRSDAASVPERWRGQVLHGVPGSVEYVLPEELARRGVVSARVILGHDGLLGVPKARLKWSTKVDTRGDM